MSKKWTYPFLAAAVLAAAVPTAALTAVPASVVYAADYTVEANKTTVKRGETVDITGQFTPNEWVTLRMIDANQNILVFDAVKSDAAGSYEFEVVIPASTPYGKITVYTGSGGQVQSVQLTVKSSSGGSGGSGGASGGSSSGSSTDETQSEGTAPSSVGKGSIVYKPKTATEKDGIRVSDITVDLSAISKALPVSDGKLSIRVEGSGFDVVKVHLTAEALEELLSLKGDAALELETPAGTYRLPVSVIDRSELADRLGAAADGVGLLLTIGGTNSTQAAELSDALQQLGAEQIGTAVDFQAAATFGSKQADLDFGSEYVSRSVTIDGTVDPAEATGVYWNESAGELSFVPTVMENSGGQTVVTMMRSGNSVYTVIKLDKSFADVPNGHWANADVELLASKLIVTGSSDELFHPSEQITRAEFATLLVRALGLEEKTTGAFSDVSSGNWYAGAVGAAYEAGIVQGYTAGTFKPGSSITRQELAVLMNKTLQFVGKDGAEGSGTELLARFGDADSIAAWAQTAVAQAAAAGITEGRSTGDYEPGAFSTRAEAVVMIKRLLQYIQFIN